MSRTEPLVGTLNSLGDIFAAFRLLRPTLLPCVPPYYPSQQDEFYLGGLPGSIDINTGSALFVTPYINVIEMISPRCTNGVIGSFSARKSEWLSKQGLLPVYAHDRHGIASVLVALVPYSEHERFAKG